MSIATDLLESIWTYFALGLVLAAGGSALLLKARVTPPDERGRFKWIGYPLLGCGCAIFAVPLLVIGCETPGC